jgi:hypothetical protein
MEHIKSYEEFRAEKLGYVYFSRLHDLIITEDNGLKQFDYLIDISENQKGTGRIFGVEIKDISSKSEIDPLIKNYKNITFPSLLVLFDNETDKGYYKWLKQPGNNGTLEMSINNIDLHDFSQDVLVQIVEQVRNWYDKRLAA